jgi:hypothetical protein
MTAVATRVLLFSKGVTFAKPAPGKGEHVLGKTKGGKPVYASGGEGHRYSDDDHHDAAKLHARAAAYHEGQAAMHAKTRDEDRDWRRSELHHREHDRHAKLRDHHFERTQEHLMAGGKAEEAEFDGNQITNRRPLDKKRVKDTKDGLAKRTHHDHPGGHNDADLAEYATFGKKGA